MKKSRLTKLTRILVNVFFYAGIAVTAAVPFIIHLAADYSEIFRRYEWEMDVIFVCSGVLAVLIFFELHKMFRTIIHDNPFVMENVTSLRRMGYYSICIMALQLIRLFLDVTIAVLVVIIVFAIAGLFSFVLSHVFRQAVIYKQENDLTI